MQPQPIPLQDGIATFQGLESVFANVIAIAIGLGGIIFFLMFLAGGFNYLTAGGEPQKAEAAKKTLTYAIGGLVLIILSYLILRFIATFTGVGGILEFRIFQTPTP